MDLEKLRQRVRDRMPRARGWYDIRNQTGHTAVLRIYDEIWFLGVNADDFARDLAEITAPEIEVQINSPGGDVFDGIAIYNALRAHPARVTTRVDGIAASIASVIAQAGDRRVVLSGGQLMVHQPWGLVIGSAKDMREYADFLDKERDVLAGIYAERSGRPLGEWQDLLATDEDHWFTAEEAVDAGLADEVVVPARKEPEGRGGAGKTLQDELAEAMGVVTAAIDSAERVGALRAEAGKTLSQVNRESLAELRSRMGQLEALLTPTDPEGQDELRREFARFVAITQEVAL